MASRQLVAVIGNGGERVGQLLLESDGLAQGSFRFLWPGSFLQKNAKVMLAVRQLFAVAGHVRELSYQLPLEPEGVLVGIRCRF